MLFGTIETDEINDLGVDMKRQLWSVTPIGVAHKQLADGSISVKDEHGWSTPITSI